MSDDNLIHVRYIGNSHPGDRTAKIVGSHGEIKIGEDGYLTEAEFGRIGRYQLERLTEPVGVVAEPEGHVLDLTTPPPPPSFGETSTPETGI
jgi:hypothetical protein